MSNAIDMNVMAALICDEEGGAESVSIGQVKEVMRLTLLYLGTEQEHRGVDGCIDVLELTRRVYNEQTYSDKEQGSSEGEAEGQGTSGSEG